MSSHSCRERSRIKLEAFDDNVDDDISKQPTAQASTSQYPIADWLTSQQQHHHQLMQAPSSPRREVVRPKALGVHHFKFAVSNLPLSLAWYERVLGGRRLPGLDHVRPDGSRFAVICQMVDWAGLLLELHEDAARALDDKEWDPVTLTVRGREDLEVWVRWLDLCGTKRSSVLVGVRGWVVYFEDPDGRRIRLYTREGHGGREAPSVSPG